MLKLKAGLLPSSNRNTTDNRLAAVFLPLGLERGNLEIVKVVVCVTFLRCVDDSVGHKKRNHAACCWSCVFCSTFDRTAMHGAVRNACSVMIVVLLRVLPTCLLGLIAFDAFFSGRCT